MALNSPIDAIVFRHSTLNAKHKIGLLNFPLN